MSTRNSMKAAAGGSDEFLSATFEQAAMGIAQTAPDGRWLRVNRKLCDIVGYSQDELLKLIFQDITHPDDLETDLAYIRQMLSGEIPACSMEKRYIRKDKAIIWINHTVALVRKPSGEPKYFITFVEDIMPRKQAEHALRESEAYLTAIIENQPGLMWLKNPESQFLAVNHAFAVACRRQTPKDVVGKTDFDIWPRELAEKYRTDDANVIRTDRSIMVEEIVYDKGEAIWFETFKAPVRDAGGNVIGTTGYARDITTRKQAEAALAESQRYLRIVLESTADGILAVDQQGKVLWANTRFFEILRIPLEQRHAEEERELLECGLGNLDDPDAYFKRVQELYASSETSLDAFRFKDGRLIERYSCPLLSAGTNIGRLWSFRDMTERDKLEDQLRQAQKVEAVGRLAGGVAHDFNNLTAIILGYGEMLQGQILTQDPAWKSVEQILEAGRRSAALTRQLLAFSRKQTLQPVVLDLNVLLRNLEQMLGRLIREDIDLRLVLNEALGCVTADPGQIEQIVTNLVVNARDAMPRGGKLTVETDDVELDETYAIGHESVVPGRYVMFALTDTGAGMDKATLGSIFEPFFTTKEKDKGTGLGLATVYGIVKQSGGYIWVYSEPGVGTTFKIYLPRTDAEPEAKTVEAVGETPRGRGERILLVEDEASLRRLCEAVLSRLNYRVTTASSGPAALLLVEEKRLAPDLVITDVIMLGMSGAEMMERLRRDRPDQKVLYMSGYPDDAIARHGVLDPGTLLLHKPFSERSIAAKVREALGRDRVAGEVRETQGEMAAAAQPGKRLLMIDDDEQFRELMRHYCMKQGHVFTGVDSAAAALAALATLPCDVLLVDLNIPGTSGERVLREIRAAGHTAPAIVLTGDVASADMELLRPLGVVWALEKSSNAEPLLQAIEEKSTFADNSK